MQTMFSDQRRKIGSVQYKQQRSEDRAPNLMNSCVDCIPSCHMHCCRSVKYELIQLSTISQMPYDTQRQHSKMQ